MAVEGRSRRGGGDLAMPMAAGFFLLAVLFAASFAFRAGPVTWAGVALLAGLASVALIVLLAMRVTPPQPAEPDLALLTRALAEPAAVIGADGDVESANEAWTAALGPAGRLQKTALGGAYGVLKAARQGALAEEAVTIAGDQRRLQAAALTGGRFLLRLSALPAAAPEAPVLAEPPNGVQVS